MEDLTARNILMSSAQRKCEEILILLLKSYMNELKKEIFEQQEVL